MRCCQGVRHPDRFARFPSCSRMVSVNTSIKCSPSVARSSSRKTLQGQPPFPATTLKYGDRPDANVPSVQCRFHAWFRPMHWKQAWVDGYSHAVSRSGPVHFVHCSPRQKKDCAGREVNRKFRPLVFTSHLTVPRNTTCKKCSGCSWRDMNTEGVV